MEPVFETEKTFENSNFNESRLARGEYEDCVFINCEFADCDLSEYKFIDCEFKGCNLSLCKIHKSSFREVVFKDCKMLGLRFDTCNEFGLSFGFENCTLNHSSFYNTKIKKTVFKNCQLQETDFTDSDVTQAVFANCDLLNAMFENAMLEKADFTSAYNYSINPEINRIKKAKFSLPTVIGLLDKYDIEIK